MFFALLLENHLEEVERAGCFAFIANGCLVTVNAMWLFLTVPWVGLQCVIVVFPGHTYFFIKYPGSVLYKSSGPYHQGGNYPGGGGGGGGGSDQETVFIESSLRPRTLSQNTTKV